jgi:hypothetical protein
MINVARPIVPEQPVPILELDQIRALPRAAPNSCAYGTQTYLRADAWRILIDGSAIDV